MPKILINAKWELCIKQRKTDQQISEFQQMSLPIWQVTKQTLH